MKKVLSVWMLIVRSSIYKVLLILGILVGFQVGAFALLTFMMPDRYNYGMIITTSIIGFLCAGLAMSVVLSTVLTSKKGKMVYTLQRLRISEEEVFLLQAAVNWMMFVLLLLVQAVVILGITAIDTHLHMSSHVGLSVFITAQRNPMMRAILPYGDWLSILATVLLSFVFGATTALTAFQYRKDDNKTTSAFFTWWMMTMSFRWKMEAVENWEYIILIGLFTVIIVIMVVTILMKGRRKRDG